MKDLFAIVPASAIILLIAIRKIMIPIKFNEEIFGEIHQDEVNNSASMRMMIGAGFGGIGLMGLILGFMLESGEATAALSLRPRCCLWVHVYTLLFANQRGYLHEIPKPPMVIFPFMIVLCLVGALI